MTGVVDTLSAGYGVINHRPWILFLPILLDLFFWFGPQISVAPLVGQVLTRPGIQRGLGPNGEQAFESIRQVVVASADDLNMLALLSPGWISVPSIMPLMGGGRGPFTFVDSWSTALPLALGTLLAGALLGCVFRSLIAQQVRDEVVNPTEVPRQAIRAWLRVLGLVLLLFAAGLLLGVPVLFVVAAATLVARELGSFGMALVMTVMLWMQLYLFFAPDAIFVSQVGPRQAIRRSVAVVRANFWAAVRIVVLITIILLGMGQVWLALASRAPWGPALGILGNAYIASGLAAASMLFYRERMDALASRRPLVAG
ncbi:MAG TPA: hypothetical protein VEQ11_01095 [Chloroflexota bacterium]|nr:hypothetical protein [Chloroflexota bacterium]